MSGYCTPWMTTLVLVCACSSFAKGFAHPNCYFNMTPNRNFHGGNDEKPSNFGAPYPIPKQTM